ncbi:hypothetical protein LOCUS_29390 [Klebsiella pneumoniae]|nr:hypothetical protein LOCUS_44400 [Klebsiella pneumoniae]GMW39285.1 hypothetical protein LOCUS_50480 [Klebsiella pneumoniae]GMW40696.1 hypothetical protein LOCUS_08720 [Klebsiella pneumoniae]GMW49326.1 hypothetical protein LOCUS_43090 [Klebsiella pneumoniae]GMW59739.1 hypothetical protein LOCUS_47910 [Klebsiella pneumoniae]
MIEGWTMSDSKINEMQGIPPFPENGEPVAVLVPPVAMNNFPLANPEED